MPTEQRKLNRQVSSLKYAHKRIALIKNQTLNELDEFVFTEAILLCKLRNKLTSIKWNLDHIVPINHKLACGLHNANNFQVVPDRWNYRKRNRNMNVYIGFTEKVPDWAV